MFRCPTCISVLEEPRARRCKTCGQNLRRRSPFVIGEAERMSAKVLPMDRYMAKQARLDLPPNERPMSLLPTTAAATAPAPLHIPAPLPLPEPVPAIEIPNVVTPPKPPRVPKIAPPLGPKWAEVPAGKPRVAPVEPAVVVPAEPVVPEVVALPQPEVVAAPEPEVVEPPAAFVADVLAPPVPVVPEVIAPPESEIVAPVVPEVVAPVVPEAVASPEPEVVAPPVPEAPAADVPKFGRKSSRNDSFSAVAATSWPFVSETGSIPSLKPKKPTLPLPEKHEDELSTLAVAGQAPRKLDANTEAELDDLARAAREEILSLRAPAPPAATVDAEPQADVAPWFGPVRKAWEPPAEDEQPAEERSRWSFRRKTG
jgi:hypothetical protein